jgi:hypothetical protein
VDDSDLSAKPKPSIRPSGIETTMYATTQIVQSIAAAPIRRLISTGVAGEMPSVLRAVAAVGMCFFVAQGNVPPRF